MLLLYKYGTGISSDIVPSFWSILQIMDFQGQLTLWKLARGKNSIVPELPMINASSQFLKLSFIA